MKRLALVASVVAIVAACTGNKDAGNADGKVAVSGVVRDWRSGAGVAGAQVRSVGITPELTTTAAADGSFTLDGVYVNGYVMIEVLAGGYVRTQSPPILVEEADLTGLAVDLLGQTDAAAIKTEFSITDVTGAGHVLGSVRRADGTGITGIANIGVFPAGFLADGPHFFDAAGNPDATVLATTSSGTFTFFNVTTGNIAVRASEPGFDFQPEGTLVRPGVWSIVTIGGAGNGSTTPTPTPTPTMTPGPQSYLTDIYPIFAARGCSAGGCHRGGGAPNGLRLEQAAATVYPLVFARCNTTTVDASLLLVKPLFEATPNHGGGNIFLNTDDPDYRKMHRWITDGALEN